MTTPYLRRLRGENVPISDGQPQQGWYRKRLWYKGPRDRGPWVPVALFEKDGGWVAVVGNGDGTRSTVTERAAVNEIWLWSARHPVEDLDGRAALASGRWPANHPAAKDDPPGPGLVVDTHEADAPAPIGHNSKPAGITVEDFEDYVVDVKLLMAGVDDKIAITDKLAQLVLEYEDYAEVVQAFLDGVTKAGGIQSMEESNRAANMADAIGKVKTGIAGRADKVREFLVKPHLDKQRQYNNALRDVIEGGDGLATTLRRLSARFVKAEQDRLQKEADEAAAAAQAAAAAEAKRLREEEEALLRQHLPPETVAEIVAETPPEPVPVVVAEQVKLQVGGARGNARSLKTKQVATFENYDLALAHFAQADLVREAVLKLAQRAVDAKLGTPPGIKVIEEAKL